MSFPIQERQRIATEENWKDVDHSKKSWATIDFVGSNVVWLRRSGQYTSIEQAFIVRDLPFLANELQVLVLCNNCEHLLFDYHGPIYHEQEPQ